MKKFTFDFFQPMIPGGKYPKHLYFFFWLAVFFFILGLAQLVFAQSGTAFYFSPDGTTTPEVSIKTNVSNPDGNFAFHYFDPERSGEITSVDFSLRKNFTPTASLYVTIGLVTGTSTEYEIPASAISSAYATVTVPLIAPLVFDEDDELFSLFYVKTTLPGSQAYLVKTYVGTKYNFMPSDLWYQSVIGITKVKGAIVSDWLGEIYKPKSSWLSAMVSTAYASTCSFVTSGNTTTATCSDPIATIATTSTEFITAPLTVGLSFLLFFFLFFGLLFYFKKERG